MVVNFLKNIYQENFVSLEGLMASSPASLKNLLSFIVTMEELMDPL